MVAKELTEEAAAEGAAGEMTPEASAEESPSEVAAEIAVVFPPSKAISDLALVADCGRLAVFSEFGVEEACAEVKVEWG